MKTRKIVSFCIFTLLISMFFCTTYANSNEKISTCTTKSIIYQKPAANTYKSLATSTITPSDFDPSEADKDNSGKDDAKDSSSVKLANKIIGGLQAVGSIVSVASLVLIGIKYMLGSAEEKADYKTSMIPYLVGAILVFCASNIIAAIYNAIK